MSAPSSDSAAIRQTIRALRAAGAAPNYAEYGGGEGEPLAPTASEQSIIDAIMAVDDCYLIVTLPDGFDREESHIRFVMGNDPEEVIGDYEISLEPILGPLVKGWWS